jgi:hypothetical protein
MTLPPKYPLCTSRWPAKCIRARGLVLGRRGPQLGRLTEWSPPRIAEVARLAKTAAAPFSVSL